MRDRILDGGAYSRTAFQKINQTATAAGGGDNTEVDGDWIDRILSATEEGGIAHSAKLVIAYTTALGDSDETLSFAVQFQDATASDGTGSADYGDAVATTVVSTGESGGSTETGTVEVDVNLAGANRYIRSQITPNLSASGTDTCEWSAVLVLFGHDPVPITQAIAKVVDDAA